MAVKVGTRIRWDEAWSTEVHNTTALYRLLRGEDIEGKEILEVGCGDLRFHNMWGFERAAQFTGIDISYVAIMRAQYRALTIGLYNSRFLMGDAREGLRALPDNSFDTVLAIETLQLLGRDYLEVLQEMARVSRRNVVFSLAHIDVYKGCPDFRERLGEFGTLVHYGDLGNVAFASHEIGRLLGRLGLEEREVRVLTQNENATVGTKHEGERVIIGGDENYTIYVSAVKRE